MRKVNLMKVYERVKSNFAEDKKKTRPNDRERIKSFRSWVALLIRSVLIVFIAIIFIVSVSKIFGSENTAFAVVLFCILFSLKYVPFGYVFFQEIVALCVLFVILIFSTSFASVLPPIYCIIVHIISLWLLFGVSCLNYPQAHGPLIAFCYIYLTGNPVLGGALLSRFLLGGIGIILASIVILIFHKKKNFGGRLINLIKFPMGSVERKEWEIWRLRLTFALSFLISLGTISSWPRFIWAGFACSSMLSPYDIKHPAWKRLCHRLVGVLEGAALFYVLQSIIPQSYQFTLGAFGGVCLGMCTHYRRQTLFNTLGALLAASQIYPLPGVLKLRIINTIVGLCFALAIVFSEILMKEIKRINLNKI